MSKKFPNILFFGIDSLRRDRMSLYGYPKLTTPHIDAFLAEDSIVFDNMFSPLSRLPPVMRPCSPVRTASAPTL